MGQQWADTESDSGINNTNAHLNVLTSGVGGVLMRRKWLILSLILLGLGIGYLYFLKSPPVYQSTAQVLLIKKDSRIPLAGALAKIDYEDAMSTHLLLVDSPLIADEALKRLELNSVKSLRGHPNPATAIMQGLQANRAGGAQSPDPNVFVLTFQGPEPADCSVILNAVFRSYQEFLGQTYRNFSDEAVGLIGEARDVLNRQLVEKETTFRKFREKAPHLLESPDGGKTSVFAERMRSIEQERSIIQRKVVLAKARIASVENARQHGTAKMVLETLAKELNSETAEDLPSSAANRLIELMLERELLAESHGADHPKIKALNKRIDFLEERYGVVKPAERGDFVQMYLDAQRELVRLDEDKVRGLDALFEQERLASKAIADYLLADESYRDDINRTKQLFATVMARIEEINLVKDAGGIQARMISPPTRGVQVAPNFLRILLTASVIGMLIGLGLAYVVDILDSSFRSPDEICQQLGLPIIGHIPPINRNRPVRNIGDEAMPSKLSTILCAWHHPRVRQSEAYRAVRTALYFSSRSKGYRVVQVTSPHPGDGKTTLAANLAVTVADTGRRVLLIDADCRRPALSELFDLKTIGGLTDVLCGHLEIADAVQTTEIPNLWVLPCGTKPKNPSELLTSPRFAELLNVVREQYDYILLDTPPLLAVTDPSVVAPRVDAVLLVMRLTRQARSSAIRATAMLSSLGTTILGVIVNSIEQESGYGYGYGYGYSYGYGSYHKSSEDSRYYEEEEEEAESADVTLIPR